MTYLSKTRTGASWLVMSRWKIPVLPMQAILVRVMYFQKTTDSGISACFSFCLESRSNTFFHELWLTSHYFLPG